MSIKFNPMKRNLLFLFMASVLMFACSTDQDNQESNDPLNAILGSWRAVEFNVAGSGSSTVNLGAEILANLAAEECYILTFDFNQDLTVVVENAFNFIALNATPAGISVDCPEQRDVESSTYTFDGSTLSIVDEDGVTQSIEVTIEGDIMTVDAADLDVDNLNAEGELIFEKF